MDAVLTNFVPGAAVGFGMCGPFGYLRPGSRKIAKTIRSCAMFSEHKGRVGCKHAQRGRWGKILDTAQCILGEM